MLVAHSLAGLVAPLVAAAAPVRRMVYLAAMLPEPGRSVDERARAGQRMTRRGIGRGQTVNEDGSTSFLPAAAVELLYPDSPPERAALAAARLRPQHWRITAEPSPLAAWPAVPATYVLCREDRIIDADWARAAAPGRAELVELPGDHCAVPGPAGRAGRPARSQGARSGRPCGRARPRWTASSVTIAYPNSRSSTGANAIRQPRIAAGSYRTMSKPVRMPLVSSWKNSTIPYAIQYVRRRISQVRSSTVSTTHGAGDAEQRQLGVAHRPAGSRGSSPTGQRFTARTASKARIAQVGVTRKNSTSSSGSRPGSSTPVIRRRS